MARGDRGDADDTTGEAHGHGDSRLPESEAARRRHYGAFYGLGPLPAGRPLLIVHGNCQAESLRIALGGDDLVSLRIPPVHELVAADLPHLHRALGRCAVLISQPVRADYRDLPLGAAQLRRYLGTDAVTLTVPVIRFTGLYPTQAIIRPPSQPGLSPPGVPYHDLRILAEAAGERLPPLRPERVRTVAAASVAALSQRERAHGAIPVSDRFLEPDFTQMRTLNHPGNPIWDTLAARVHTRLGLARADPLTRPLLNAVHAPREAAVLEAFGLDGPVIPEWTVHGEQFDPDRVRALHLGFYRAHPEVVSAGLIRHRATLEQLGA